MSPTFRFVPAMYRAAVVDLIKTQTRRLMTPQPHEEWRPEPGPCYRYSPGLVDRHGDLYPGPEVYGIATEDEGWIATYGPPGTVRPAVTTWALSKDWDDFKPSDISDADVNILRGEMVAIGTGIWWNDGTPKPAWAGKSRPAMFFPKSLYPLARQARVVSVKAEPVQDISAADAIAEGIAPLRGGWVDYSFPRGTFDCPVKSYRSLWDSINAERGQGALKGQYAWARNPWVFATTFEVLPLAQ